MRQVGQLPRISGDKVPSIFNFGSSWKVLVCLMLWLVYPRNKLRKIGAPHIQPERNGQGELVTNEKGNPVAHPLLSYSSSI